MSHVDPLVGLTSWILLGAAEETIPLVPRRLPCARSGDHEPVVLAVMPFRCLRPGARRLDVAVRIDGEGLVMLCWIDPVPLLSRCRMGMLDEYLRGELLLPSVVRWLRGYTGYILSAGGSGSFAAGVLAAVYL